MILKAYLHCIPSNQAKHFKSEWPILHFQAGSDVKESMYVKGLVLDLMHSTNDDISTTLATNTSDHLNALVLNIPIDKEHFVKNFNQSSCQKEVLEGAFDKNVQNFLTKLVTHQIHIIFNQTFVSDEVKTLLRNKRIICLDRIGVKSMNSLQRLTKCKLLLSLSENIEPYIGLIDSISTLEVSRKVYIKLEKSNTFISSLIVCFRYEAMNDDVRHVINGALSVLECTLKSKKVFLGQGLLDQGIIDFINQTYLFESTKSKNFHSRFSLQNLCDIVSESFAVLIPSDSGNDKVYDCFNSKLNAIAVAFQTSALLLGINFCISSP